MGTAARGQQGRPYSGDELEARLRAALVGLLADGATFRDLSVASIIDAAGVARSTFYAHYEDKAAMLLALGVSTLRQLYEGQREWISRGAAAGRGEMVLAFRRLLDDYLADATILRALNECSAYDARVRGAYAGAIQEFAGALGRMIAAGQRNGTVRPLDTATTAQVIAWMTERTVTMIAPHAEPRELDRLAAALADVIDRTLFAPAPGWRAGVERRPVPEPPEGPR